MISSRTATISFPLRFPTGRSIRPNAAGTLPSSVIRRRSSVRECWIIYASGLLETGRQPANRLAWKLRIIKGLYRQGRSEEEIRQLLRFIDAVMALPETLDQTFIAELTVFEEEQRFITSVERIGMERGMKKGLEEGRQEGRQEGAVQTARESAIAILQERFGAVPAGIDSAH